MTTSVTRSLDGTSIVYDRAGDGNPAIVLVHGWSCDRSYWRHQVRWLEPSYRTVALDLAGHGDSGQSRREWTMEAFGEDVVAVADAVGRIIIVPGANTVIDGSAAAGAVTRLGPSVVVGQLEIPQPATATHPLLGWCGKAMMSIFRSATDPLRDGATVSTTIAPKRQLATDMRDCGSIPRRERR